MAPFEQGKLGVQPGIDPATLGRGDRILLDRRRYSAQLNLIDNGRTRFTLIKVNEKGRIIDGHHGTRAAIDRGIAVDVEVFAGDETPEGPPAVREMRFQR